MAELVVTQDELALRRRARRRLVGAIAIALTVVVALPMLFDNEPKPFGPEVDIRIPAQNTPFNAPPIAVPQLPAEPEAIVAEPTQKPAPSLPTAATTPVDSSRTSEDQREADPAQRVATTSKPVATVEKPPAAELNAEKTDRKSLPASPAAAENAKPKPEAKATLKPDTPFASQGYFLQLGAFGSEANARQLYEKATAAGFKVVVIGSNGQYRVRVGPIPQHERAMEIQAKLKAKGFSPVLLGP